MPILKKVKVNTGGGSQEVGEEPRRRFFGKTKDDQFESSVEIYFAANMQEAKAKKQKENLKPIIIESVKVDDNRVGERNWELVVKDLLVSVSSYDRHELNESLATVLLTKRGILERCQETKITEAKVLEAYHEGLLSDKDLKKILEAKETTCLRISQKKK